MGPEKGSPSKKRLARGGWHRHGSLGIIPAPGTLQPCLGTQWWGLEAPWPSPMRPLPLPL